MKIEPPFIDDQDPMERFCRSQRQAQRELMIWSVVAVLAICACIYLMAVGIGLCSE